MLSYVLLPLANKEAALVYGRAEYSQAGRDVEKIDWVKADAMKLPKEKDAKILLIGHILMVIHKLLEMGQLKM